jgi:hypothetical protein
VPKGRDEAELEWPMAWLGYHDQYKSKSGTTESRFVFRKLIKKSIGFCLFLRRRLLFFAPMFRCRQDCALS